MIYTVTFNPALEYRGPREELALGRVNRTVSEDVQLGGKGINVSWVLRELGHENVALGFVAGFTGKAIEDGLAAKGVATDFIHLPAGLTRINVKLKAGEETEINGKGPDISAEALEELYHKLDAQRCVREHSGPAGGQKGALRGGCHPGSAGKRAEIPALRDQAQQP